MTWPMTVCWPPVCPLPQACLGRRFPCLPQAGVRRAGPAGRHPPQQGGTNKDLAQFEKELLALIQKMGSVTFRLTKGRRTARPFRSRRTPSAPSFEGTLPCPCTQPIRAEERVTVMRE